MTLTQTMELSVPEIETEDLQLLGKVEPLYNRLYDVVAPTDRLDTYERLATVYFGIAAKFTAKARRFLLLIEKEGLWKLPRDPEGHPRWSNFYAYAQDFMSNIKNMSRRTIASQISMSKILMLDLGIEDEFAAALLDDKPTIAAHALEAFTFDEFSGQFVGIQPEARDRIMQELQIDTGEKFTDKDLAKEYLKEVARAEHGDAAALVNRVKDTLHVWLSYDRVKDEIVVNGHGRTPEDRTIQMFRRVYVPKHPKQRLHKRALGFLLTKLRADQQSRHAQAAD